MFEDEKIDFIESLPESDAILIIWIKLLTLAGKCNSNGFIFLTEKIPYTEEMLAHKFRRPLSTVKLAMETLVRLEMIEMGTDGYLKIKNWEKHQNIDGLDKIREQTRKRVAKHREKQKLLQECNVTGNATVTDGNATELEEELEEDIDIEEEVEDNTSTTLTKENIKVIIKTWNELGLQKLKAINPNTNRYKMLKARIKEYSFPEVVQAMQSIDNSTFLKGQNKRNWTITFDWFVKPNNFLKVLEGNYIDENKENSFTQMKNGATKNKLDLDHDYDMDAIEQQLLKRSRGG